MRADTLSISLLVLVILSATLNLFSHRLVFKSEDTDPRIDLPLVVHESLLLNGITATDLSLRNESILIIDGFTMNDELDMLEIRIEELWDVVDYFIIVEARKTFQNNEKPLFYEQNKSKFSKYASKIIHVALDKGSEVVVEWENEVYFRNAIGHFGIPQIEKTRGIKVKDSHIIMVGDIDEIPDHRVISFLRTYQGYPTTCVFSLRWSYYSFLWLNKNKLEGTVAVTVGDLRKFNSDLDTNWVRYNRLEKQGKEIWVIGRMGLWAGWHCSWCMPPESMVRKLESYAHNQLQHKPGAKDIAILKERRKNGVWIDSEIVEGDRVSYTGLPDDLVAPQYLFTPKAKQKFGYMFD